MKKPTEKEPTIELQELDTQTFDITLTGISPLVIHQFSTKTKKAIAEKSQGKGTRVKKIFNEEEDYQECFYDTVDGNYGFPALAFKKAVVNSVSSIQGMTKVLMRQLFHIPVLLVAIQGEPERYRAPVRVNGKGIIRIRPMFREWNTTFTVLYNAAATTPALIYNLFNHAGFSVGVGEHRPEKDGQFGMFKVKK